MTPKEKANELVEKFMKPIDELHKYPMCFSTAKQCALITCNEVLGYMGADRGTEFWLKVKQEIEKL
jgi:hypothetical protein